MSPEKFKDTIEGARDAAGGNFRPGDRVKFHSGRDIYYVVGNEGDKIKISLKPGPVVDADFLEFADPKDLINLEREDE